MSKRGRVMEMTRTTRGIARIARMMKTTRTIMPDANDKERQQSLAEEEVVASAGEVEEIEVDVVVHIRAQVIRKVGAVVGQVI